MAKILNTTEIESALRYFENTFANLCERIKLPERTFEGRTCHALMIGKPPRPDKPAVLILGGVHAREWGGPDIVVNFAADLLRAYAKNKGLKYLTKAFTAAEIRTIVETMTVVIFPCVNPDGVTFSHTIPQHYYWRKNRNPASAQPDRLKTIGVDINRNYDFLWDFKKAFDQKAWPDVASDDPAEETFHGTAPFSEPETRNVKWLMDHLPKLTLFLDLHSFAGDVLYSWGDDRNQSTDPYQSFTNPAYDGKRGRVKVGYKEYLSAPDQKIAKKIAKMVADAMKSVRGQHYKAEQAVGLYPTSGTSDDYCFSRHIVDSARPKTFSFTVEFNIGKKDQTFLVTANPKTLDQTMRDVIPGLITFCLSMPGAPPR